MPVEYDLVILGGAAYARRAALQAAAYGARVALVEPPGLFDQGQRQQYLLQGLQQLGETLQRQAVGKWFGLSNGGEPDWKKSGWRKPGWHELDWPAVLEWVAIAAETQLTRLSVDAMSRNGVDVVLEEPQRLTRKLTVMTESRQLRARGVLVASGHLPAVIEKLQQVQTLPHSISIVGGTPEALEWVWVLHDCGVQVDVIADEILPSEDQDIRRIVRSQLMAAGISVCSAREQLSEHSLPEATGSQTTGLKNTGLKNTGSKHTLPIEPTIPALTLPDFISLKTNRKMQTKYPRVFACGSILGGSTHARLAQSEVNVALRNALFWPSAKVNYANIPQTYTRFATLGLTQAQAEARYGSAVQTFKTSRANADCLSQTSPMPNYFKLVCVNNRLLGAHCFGQGASDWIWQWAPKMDRSIGVVDGIDIGASDRDEVLALMRYHRWQPGYWRRDWAENWFNWRRRR
ncbi:MAG: FAD-dependent oxidoreductase [Cyanobacteria bacterium P01_D01_bin.105]